MKPLGIILAGLLLAASALAQRGGGGNSGGGHAGGGHSGGSGFHGGGGGHSGSVGGHGGYAGSRSYGRSVVIPYAVPVYGYGGYAAPSYGYGYNDADNGYAAPPPVAQPMEQPMDQSMSYGPDGGQPAPPPADDSLRVYQAPAPSPQEAAVSEGRYYLIAYKDHSVYTALAYWMENGTLNYVTPQNAHNQVTLDLLDIELTKQLNARRGYAFNIINR